MQQEDGILGDNPKYPDIKDSDSGSDAPPDKVVIYASFTTNNNIILDVLKLYKIHPLVVTGEETAAKRAKTLQKFRESVTDNVLLVSEVALQGLNLAHANILIILVAHLLF